MNAKKGTARTKWLIDQENSEISFTVKHLLNSHVKGEFKTFDASISTIGNNFRTAQINFWIDTSSITTNHVKRDWHLKSSDFLNVKSYRYITFTSNSIGVSSNGDYELGGELTILGITHEIKLDVHFGGELNDHWGYERAAFTVSGVINRSDWGLTWNTSTETGCLVVADEVNIQCEVELTDKDQKEKRIQLESARDYSFME